MSTKPGSTERLQVAGIPQPLYAALQRIADREGKTMSRAGLDALEAFAADRGEWPPGQPKPGKRPSAGRLTHSLTSADIAWATEQVMAVLERREPSAATRPSWADLDEWARPVGAVRPDATDDEKRAALTAFTIPQKVRGADLNITIGDKIPVPLRVTVSRHGQPQRLYIARDGVVKVLRVCFARGACPGCGKSPNGDWRGWHADDCALVAFCEANGIDLSEVEDG